MTFAQSIGAAIAMTFIFLALVWALIAVSARETRQEESLDVGAPEGDWDAVLKRERELQACWRKKPRG